MYAKFMPEMGPGVISPGEVQEGCSIEAGLPLPARRISADKNPALCPITAASDPVRTGGFGPFKFSSTDVLA
jgi:hypothetical protein